MSAAVVATGLQRSLPSSWYRDPRVFAVEKEQIFCREWLAVCRAEELPEPGDHRVIDVLGESILLVRNRDGDLRAFYNVCRHRGARLCGNAAVTGGMVAGGLTAGRMIVCRYHQWSYDLNGALVAAPHLAADPNFSKSEYSLYPVAVDAWGGFVFIHLTPSENAPLALQLGGAPERTQRYPLSELRIGATRRYQVAANWKILSENYNECYHCAGVHPELCAVVPSFKDGGGSNLDWQRGVAHREGAYTFTRDGTTRRRAFPGLNADEQVRHKGELLYPNLWVSLACDHAAVFILQPRGPELTEITCQFLFEPHELAKADFDASDTVEFWDLVNRQDWAVCESVQAGIRSRVHRQGYYAPMEDLNLDIRRYVSERIAHHLDGAID
jgi:Rieske 2Fe-2S family protein